MASLPLFFHQHPFTDNDIIGLEEDTARHIVQVLRMQNGEKFQLTDGKGNMADVIITEAGKKKCTVQVLQVTHHNPPKTSLHLAVAFTKNTARNEWLLEKATELGVRTIIPLLVNRSEKERIRPDRWNGILIAAMLQSQQYYLPMLTEPTKLPDVLKGYNAVQQRLIGHCIDSKIRTTLPVAMKAGTDTIVLIGPEGDFTNEEVDICMQNGYVGVTMAQQRLRTETAAMNVCAYFNTINNETN